MYINGPVDGPRYSLEVQLMDMDLLSLLTSNLLFGHDKPNGYLHEVLSR